VKKYQLVIWALPLILAASLGGSWINSLILLGISIMVTLNQWLLMRVVVQTTKFVSQDHPAGDNKKQANRLIFQSIIKLTLLATMIAVLYVLKQELIVKALILIIFQLIIFVVSIKNNSLKDLGLS
jgi:hypothetical protein